MAHNMSFLPEDYLEKRLERRTNLICLGLFVVVSAATLGAFYVRDFQVIAVRKQQKSINGQFEEAAKRLGQLEQMQQRKQDMKRKAAVTAELLERVPRTLILSELINNMPADLSLLEFKIETKIVRKKRSRVTTALDVAKKKRKSKLDAAKAEPIKVTEVNLKLVGVAPTDVEVAKFMHALGNSPLFNDVNLAFSEQVVLEGKELRKFQIDMRLLDGLDLRKIEPKLVKRPLKSNPMGPGTGTRSVAGATTR